MTAVERLSLEDVPRAAVEMPAFAQRPQQSLGAWAAILTASEGSPKPARARLRFAIANKRLIRFTYHAAVRVAEPHDYGLRDGVPKLLAYQRQKGGCKDRSARGWRSLEISKIQDCMVLEDAFSGTREDADQQHHHWDVLFARVDHPT